MARLQRRTGGPRATGYADAARLLATGELGSDPVEQMLVRINRREELSDHDLVVVLKLLLVGGDELPQGLREKIVAAVLDYRYWMDEPGVDSMCHWSESHQLLFSACEHLAGQTFADRIFTNDGRRGSRKAERGRLRILEWLGNRFRYGFGEWLSPAYHRWNAIGLCLVIEHTADEDLRTRASMVLDLLLVNLALHRFDGRFIATAGRSDGPEKFSPERSPVNPLLAHFFDEANVSFDLTDATSVVTSCTRYRMPRVVGEIAQAEADHTVHSSHGLDVREVEWEVSRRRGLSALQRRDQMVNLLWSMEAFTTPESIGVTAAAVDRMKLQRNAFLAPLMPLLRLRSERLMTAAIRSLNPISQGIALNRANVTTYRTPHYLLSSAQHYQPGGFGDQQHLWTAALPGDITVFSTHPGATMISEQTRPVTPSAWVGNGINPDIGQDRNVALVLHDLRVRAGYLEGRRHQLSHLYFPMARFDESKLGTNFVVGRREDSFIAVMSLERLEMASEHEIVQRGELTAWAVAVADRSEFVSMNHLIDHVRRSRLRYAHGQLVWTTPEHRYSLRWRGDFEVDGRAVDSFHPRLHCDWAHIPRQPSLVRFTGQEGELLLDWKLGQRFC